MADHPTSAGPRIEAVYPLTALQQGMVVQSLCDETSGTNLVQWVLDLTGPLDVEALRTAWAVVVQHHGVLRTGIAWQRRDRPLQVVRAEVPLPWTELDWTTVEAAQREAHLTTWLERDRQAGLDLRTAPLFRLALARCHDELHQLIWTCHHVLLDGWSSSIVLRDLGIAYRAAVLRTPPTLAPVRPFREFVQWTQRQDRAAAESYWRDALDDYPGACPLSLGRTAAAVSSVRPGAWTHSLSQTLDRAVRDLAAAHRLTEPALLASAWLLALTRVTGRRASRCGVTVAGRPPALDDAERMVGLFIATLPLGVPCEGLQQRAVEWASVVQRRMAGAQAHAWVPPDVVRRAARISDGTPLFEAIFVYENYPDAGELTGALPGGVHVHVRDTVEDPGLPLTCIVAPGEVLRIRLLHDVMRVQRSQVALVGEAMVEMLQRWSANPASTLQELAPWLGDHSVVLSWQGPRPAIPDGDLWSHVLRTCAEHGDRTALEDGTRRVTFRELVREVDAVAGALDDVGVRRGGRVGILAERGHAFLVAMLAAVRQGATYVPLSPDYPPDRLQWMVEDASVRCVLVDGLVPEWVTTPAWPIAEACARTGPVPPAAAIDATWPVYVMYTSGSTGRPKGTVVPHEAVVRLIAGDVYLFMSPGARVGWASTVCFDASTLEVWAALLRGGTLVLLSRDTMLDVDGLAATLSAARLDLLWLSAGLFHTVARQAPGALGSVGQVMAGGDALRPWAIEAVLSSGPPGRLLNGYGPTENTTFTTTCDLGLLDRPMRDVPIGTPIGHTDVYVLDESLQPVAAGVVGEIYTGGRGLADGYWGRPAVTAERFVPDPFSGVPGARLYRTGDWGRWLAPGVLGFDGRRDGQIKIRGFRVEVGEVEAALRVVPGVRDAVVVARSGAGDELQLHACVIETHPGATAAVSQVLEARLPAPWRPSVVHVVEAFPLNANGKVDRTALRDGLVGAAVRDVSSRPWSLTVRVLAGIWEDVLGQPVLAEDADFFALGGHSLLVTVVVSRIREAFGVALPLQAVFEAPRLAGLAARVDAARLADVPTVAPPGPMPRPAGPLPVSFAQQRLWFLDRFAPLSAAYHIPHALRLRGPLDVEALRAALDAVVSRHEALRTTFVEVDGQPAQVVHEPAPIDVPVIDVPDGAEGDREAWLSARVRAGSDAPFDLSRGPLWRAEVLRLSADDHVLAVTLHHIIADGWSMGLVSRELAAAYRASLEGRPLSAAPLPLQYPDFAIWQREVLAGEALNAQRDYWIARLTDAVPAEVPADHPRPPRQSFRGRSMSVHLPGELSDAVRLFARRHDATVFMVLDAALLAVLYRYTGQRDLTLGTPIANRHHAALEPLIGFFVNMLALRVAIDPAKGLADVVARVRRHALEAYDRQDLPFEMLVEAVRPVRDPSRPPLVQITMAVHNVPVEELSLPGLTVASESSDLAWVRFDLELHLWERPEGIQGYWAWATDLYDEDTIADLHRHFVSLLHAGLQDSRRAVAHLPLADPVEHRQWLTEGNQTEVLLPTRWVHEEVEARWREAPSSVALRQGAVVWSRMDLEVRASRLARALRGRGVRVDDRVAIALERSPEWIMAMLAIVRAGASYVAVDTQWPAVRQQQVAHEAGAALVIDARLLSVLDAEADRVESEVPDAPGCRDGRRGAYVISTSGSTGYPKAVLIPHVALANHMAWMLRHFPLEAGDRVLHRTAPTFDAAVWECWAPLMAGVPMVLPDPRRHADPRHLVETMQRERVTVLQVVPSVLRLLLDIPEFAACTSLRQLFVGGEALTADLVAQVRALLDVTLINLYGPAEATIDACAAVLPTGVLTAVPIGRPIDNMRAYVLDDALELVPTCVPGELYLAGEGLARGYLGRPGATADRFIPDPFSRQGGGRLYRTGDRVRRRRDGQLEYLGRRDGQVKIRGQRVELGEVEAALRQLPGVTAAAADVRTDDGEPRLIAWVVPATSSAGARREDAQARVAEWQTLYETVYREHHTSEQPLVDEFDITGWTNSYTGQALPDDEMRRWRDGTVARLQALRPTRVLEIGCGTGLLLLAIAGDVEAYHAVDFSAPVIARLSRAVAARGWSHVDLATARADEAWRTHVAADLVILNSVVQYFPDAAYLTQILTEAIARTATGGSIFVGDVRCLPLLECFHAGVQAARAPHGIARQALAQRVEQACRREEELVIDPEYFVALAARLPRVAGVDIRPKPFDDDNELARYRYDVVLELDAARVEPGGPTVRMSPIPESRLWRDRALLAWLRGTDGAATLGEWLAQGAAAARSALVPVVSPMEPGSAHVRTVDLATLVNEPLPGKISRARTPEWRRWLESRLPAALVPQVFVCLDALPLTAGGKVNRRALPAPDRDGLVTRTTLARPATPTEQELAALWSRLLGLSEIGVHEEFFAVGGHSLLVVMLASAIEKHFGVALGIPTLFADTTVAGQARAIDASRRDARTRCGAPLPGGHGPLVFAFPPLLGLGLAFQGIARHLPDWTVYALDFPEAPDPVAQCVAEIVHAQPSGDIVMLAYSAGGPLAYAVIRALEVQGRVVRRLLGLDAVLVDRGAPLSATARAAVVDDNLRHFESIAVTETAARAWLDTPDARHRLAHTMDRYLAWLDAMPLAGPIAADVVLIASTDARDDDGRLDWREWTTGHVEVVTGAGVHLTMATGTDAAVNAALIARWLARPGTSPAARG